MKFSNGKLGMHVIMKGGMHDRGRIDFMNGSTKTFGVTWLLQDGTEFSPRVDPGDVRPAPQPPRCAACGQEVREGASRG